jgi:hypothetical protein
METKGYGFLEVQIECDARGCVALVDGPVDSTLSLECPCCRAPLPRGKEHRCGDRALTKRGRAR